MDARLGLTSIAPFSYRLATAYLIRSQADYKSVFHLDKFRGKHSDWKPGLARILGFDADAVADVYRIEAVIEDLDVKAQGHSAKLLPDSARGRIDTRLLLGRRDLANIQKRIDDLDFSNIDDHYTDRLVEDLDLELAELNMRRYHLRKRLRKTRDALQDSAPSFDVTALRRTFDEAGAALSGGIVKDFQNLISFNQSITTERKRYLMEEEAALSADLETLAAEISELNTRLTHALAVIGDNNVFSKYRKATADLAEAKADLILFESQRRAHEALDEIKMELQQETIKLEQARTQVERDLKACSEDAGSLFSKTRVHFADIMASVIDRKALLSVDINKLGHLDFTVDLLDEKGDPTSAGEAHTYQKLICVAFDLAVLRAHEGSGFPRFAFHDGVLETLDPRKKENLLRVLREYADLGYQPIMTVMSSDIEQVGFPELRVDTDEVILTLHDDGSDGRLFRIPAF